MFEYGKSYMLHSYTSSRFQEKIKCTGILRVKNKIRFESGCHIFIGTLSVINGIEVAKIIKPITDNYKPIRADATI